MQELLTPAEVASVLKVTPKTVVRWLNEKRFKGLKLGEGKRSEWRVRRADLDAYLDSLEPK